MVDIDRRPSAQEIEELIDLVRRDPGSPAFIDLGEAYLSLGRPRDAIQVGNLGLENAPDNLEGRVMLARAFAALHQWKEAQGELLRVVKVDRSNRVGFALLGEVLLRRNDYERAVPVLQHAQNLDPTSPAILSMLRRARAGQPLDPPVPIPQPVPPRGETGNPVQIQRSRPAPATVPQKPARAPLPPPAQMAAPMMVPTAAPAMPTMAIEPAPAGYPDASAGYPSAPPPARSAPKTAPPPMSVEGIRPRVISGQKQQNAAAASLRQSASVGENYLNDLLTGGLLDVAGVRVPDAEFDLRPDRRWGRSTRRAFIFLFVVLVLGIGGGGTWYWWSEQQKSEAVAKLQKDAKRAIGHGEYGSYDPEDPERSFGLEAAIGKLNEALQADKSNLITFAYVVEVTGLEALLYGKEVERVERAIKAVENDIKPGDRGERELVIGKAAVGLARLYSLAPEAAKSSLEQIHKILDAYLAKHQADRWAMWLKGRALLAGGARKEAAGRFTNAAEGEDGLALALIDRADLLADDGQLDEALELYKKANEKSKNHPLMVLGRALARAEAVFDDEEVVSELNEKFTKATTPPRAEAYRQLALAITNIMADEWETALTALQTAQATGTAPGDPRFWSRVAWAYYLLGDYARMTQARAKVYWFSTNQKKVESDQTVQLVDAALLLGSGLPEQALELATKLAGRRPRSLRVYADLDLGKYKDAKLEAEALYQDRCGADPCPETGQSQLPPQLVEAGTLRAQARMMAATTDAEREEQVAVLDKFGKRAHSKLPRHALGVAWLAAGKIDKAKSELEAAISGVSEKAPNPVAYRTLMALAEVALAERDFRKASDLLDWSLYPDVAKRPEIALSNGSKISAIDPTTKQRTPYADHLKANSGFFPARASQAKVLLRANLPDNAYALLTPMLKEVAEDPTKASAITPAIKLTLAEVLIARSGAPAEDKKRARELIIELRDAKAAPPAELGRIAALLDKGLPKELDLPEPEDPTAEKGPRRPPPRRGR